MPTPDTTAITLDITQRLIDRGVRENCGACPIAIAFKEAAPGAIKVSVSRAHISFFALGYAIQYLVHLPPTGQEFVQAFDCGNGEPCTFDVAIPSFLCGLPGFLADDDTEGSEAEKAAWAGMPL